MVTDNGLLPSALNTVELKAATRPLFQANHLVKTYGKAEGVSKVVDDLSFHIAAGECFGLIGPNGAGKTTTLKICLGQIAADSGSVMAFGMDVQTHLLAVKKRTGVVSQFDTLDPDFSCEENILAYGRYYGMRDVDIRLRIPELLDFAALTHKAKARPGELSGGMKRRLSLARALVNRPDLLVLDEPTTGLDPQARHLMWERLRELLATGMSILLTTHFMDEAERLCTRLCMIDHGKKIIEGTPRDLIAAHLTPEITEEIEGVGILKRRSNLEDLFFKFTGRQIRMDS
jgi:lipooligosaccharide transport system ATP-binding protein